MKIPFAYLVLSVGWNMVRLDSSHVVVQKVVSKLSNWKVNTLSIGKRLTLIKLVLGSVHTYFISLYKAPKRGLTKVRSSA